MRNLFDQAYRCILLAEPEQKVAETKKLLILWRDGALQKNTDIAAVSSIDSPGRPPTLKQVIPSQLPRRTLHTEQGKAALIHSIAHIEFNAIDLALDAIYRFRHMPCQYYDDWLSVAAEESRHFQLIQSHLHTLGYTYGDFAVHRGLWDMAQQTDGDVMVRMALVPRVMEARGLDVTPGIRAKFARIGDDAFVEILNIIERDEVGHVEIGSFWFHYLCDERGLSRQQTFQQLLQQYTQGRIKLPLARQARLKAGFSEQELIYLEGLA